MHTLPSLAPLQPSSQEYSDACELWELYEETKGVLLTGVFGQDVPHNTDSNEGYVLGDCTLKPQGSVSLRFKNFFLLSQIL
jgi:hypothetical protein